MDTVTQAPATDDQELAKVLESMNASASGTQVAADVAATTPSSDDVAVTEQVVEKAAEALQFEETPAFQSDALVEPSMVTPPSIPEPSVMAPLPPLSSTPTELTGDSELDSIKKDALSELRPLVDKLDLPAEEKFDTLLLIIRSTDDKTLVAAAHEAAKAIDDETKRAEALLDVIKEIDYFANPQR